MTQFVRVSALVGTLLVTGCSSWTPSWDFLPSMRGGGGGANVSLTIESDPPGADARTSLGAACKTPCMLPVPGDREFAVSYSMPGYMPQTVAVTPNGGGAPDIASGSDQTVPASVSPNPVYAQLQPAPPPTPSRKKARAPKKKQAAAPKQ